MTTKPIQIFLKLWNVSQEVLANLGDSHGNIEVRDP